MTSEGPFFIPAKLITKRKKKRAWPSLRLSVHLSNGSGAQAGLTMSACNQGRRSVLQNRDTAKKELFVVLLGYPI